MRIVGQHNDVERDQNGVESGDYWEMLYCDACREVVLRSGFWVEFFDQDEFEWKIIYPAPQKGLSGLPDQVQRAYDAAQRVRQVEPNAYAVLLGRVLEFVAMDQHASGDTLAKQLKDLADRRIIPEALADMANQIRAFRNIGAHAGSSQLTSHEMPILDNLCAAVLEYVYVAPTLIQSAQDRLAKLNEKAS